jgi:hypothetical protein
MELNNIKEIKQRNRMLGEAKQDNVKIAQPRLFIRRVF